MSNTVQGKPTEVTHTYSMTRRGDIFRDAVENTIYMRDCDPDDFENTALALCDGEQTNFDPDDKIVFLGEVTIKREE